MKITVTAEDIDGGIRRDPHNCPVARALRRAGVAHSGVGGIAVMLGNQDQRMMVFLPGPAQEWIMQFDWGQPVQPFEFEIVLPSDARRKSRSLPRREKSLSSSQVSMTYRRMMTPAEPVPCELAGI